MAATGLSRTQVTHPIGSNNSDTLHAVTIEINRRRSLLMPTDKLSVVGSIDLLCRFSRLYPLSLPFWRNLRFQFLNQRR
ncbi:MAG: hypothetical protein RLZZ597_429 [Cyanobacteriota bacterium]|jgi:hypothetical protein